MAAWGAPPAGGHDESGVGANRVVRGRRSGCGPWVTVRGWTRTAPSCPRWVWRGCRLESEQSREAVWHPPVEVAHDRDERGNEQGADDQCVDQDPGGEAGGDHLDHDVGVGAER